MEGFDWVSTIKTNLLLLYYGGMWPKDEETHKFNLYTIYSIFMFLTFTVYHNFSQVFNLFFVTNLQDMTSCVFLSLTQSMAIVKAFYIIQNMKTLKSLISTLHANRLFQPKNLKQIKMVEPSLNEWKLLFRMFWLSAVGTINLLMIFPLLDNSYKQYRLPLMSWHPFSTKSSPMYEIIYIHQIVSCYTVAIVDMSADTLISALNMFIGTQCDILCDNIRNIDGSVEEMGAKWKECIVHHKEIIKFAKQSQIFFNWIVLLQFCVSVISIGLTMFRLTLVVPMSSEFLTLGSYLGAITVEIFMYCWFGNEVELKSAKILYATFESNWVDLPLPIKKNILIFALRSQNPIKMSSLNIFYLTLDTFKAIFRTSWSYFAVLRQVNERE